MNKNINIDIKKLKAQAVNIALIALFLLVGSRIYKAQINKAAALSEHRQREAGKAEILSELNKDEKAAGAYDKFFGRKDISAVMSAINSAAKGTGVKVNSIKPERELSYSDYILKYGFRVEFAADSYHAVGRFIQQLENYPEAYYVIDAFKLRLASGRERQAVYKLSADLTVSGFALKE